MSGFSADWLALREPVDHRSRNEAVRDAALELFDNRDEAHVVDLGCGSGSNLRALAPHLPKIQEWTLVDYDPKLLAAARAALTKWAAHHENEADGALRLERDGKTIFVTFREADLARDLESVLDHRIDLVTAAAFFDLVASSWIKTFCAALIARQLPLYTVLTYDGVEIWRPEHAGDAAMLAAFHAHQATDKGFGPAAGPQATQALTDAFASAGWEVQTGQSAWLLDAKDAGLIAMLAEGSAGAVRETGRVPAAEIASWLAARRKASQCCIGHEDFFAAPPRPVI
jgi:SAM-dependent methyltransferase